MPVTIEPIPAFNDNYIWLIHNELGQAFVVDPGDPKPVLDTLAAKALTLCGILITHHHPDHVGGVDTLKSATSCKVFGPENPSISGIDHHLGDADSVDVLGTHFDVITVPGHTLDHIAYFGDNALFCGDTLFAGGCGRVFEGTFPMMRASLERLRDLPASTRVYCAHEYTLANLRFALAAEPDNQALMERDRQCQDLRAQNKPTVPSSLEIERAINPFLRWDQPSIQKQLEAAGRLSSDDADATFAALRSWKDTF